MLLFRYKRNFAKWLCANNEWLCNNVTKNGVQNMCYCLTFGHCTIEEMEQDCYNRNSTIAHDINDEETELFLRMVNNLSKFELVNLSVPMGGAKFKIDSRNMCPPGFHYFNNSCFVIHPTISNPSKKLYYEYINDYCKKVFCASAASLHSFEEQWFTFHLYSTIQLNDASGAVTLGGYIFDKKNPNSSIRWYDGSLFDYHPKWGYLRKLKYIEPYLGNAGLYLL